MSATLSILFTDAVASTDALSRLGDERFGVVQEAHLGLLRSAAGAHGGREVKSLGDGLMVVFTGAADALGCAVAMQQAVEAADRRGEQGLALRVGVSSGDVTVGHDGDVHGAVVVEAARLCAAAGAGRILASQLARGLAGSRGRHAFTSLGLVELAGLAEPVAAVDVGWAPVADGDGLAPVALPPRLAAVSSWTFVGREREVEELEALWREVVDGERRVALLGGEPGAGKTRLAREIAVRAHREGALGLFGRIDEELAVAYQPFAEALRHYLASVDDVSRARVLGLRGGVLGRLVPEVVEQQPEGQVEAWAVFEGLVDWLSGEAAHRPVVLVLDDLHWAAKPTLQALMHLVRSERLGRVLIVGTYRDTELDRRHPLAAVLADLRREDGVERLSIRGLDPDGVAAFVQAARGDVLDEGARQLATLLSEQTQGNPFFVGQVLRHLAESGIVEQVDGRWVRGEGADEFAVPEGVRDVVGRRISRLSDQTGDLLQVAAVAGPEFETAVVAEVAGQPTGAALDSFDEAVRSRLLLETHAPGRLRFAHALVRQTLEAELTTLRRVHLHRDIAVAVERRSEDADSAVAELAYHFAEAAAAGQGERAAHYAERAAVQAMERGGLDQAVDLLERALELLPVDADPDGLRRDRLYAQLAPCYLSVFDQVRLEDTSRRWMALGRALGDDVMRVNASTWFTLSIFARRLPEPEDVAVIAEALRIDPWTLDMEGRRRLSLLRTWCDQDAAGLRAWLLGNAAAAWGIGVPLEAVADGLPAGDPHALADEACRVAAQSIDPAIVDETRYLRAWALLGSPDADAHLLDAEQAARTGYSIGGGGWVPAGLALARLGRLDDLLAWTDEMMGIAERRGDRSLLGSALLEQAMVALARGRFEEADSIAEEVIATLPDQVPYQAAYALLKVGRLIGLGHWDEARPIAELLDANPAIDCSHVIGVVAAAQGEHDPPRAVLDAWHGAGRPLPVDVTRGGRLWGLAECAHAAGDRDAATHLYDVLTPYDGQLLILFFSYIPASAAFVLGLLAETLGQRERALGHYRDALAFEERCGAEGLAARTRDLLARLGR